MIRTVGLLAWLMLVVSVVSFTVPNAPKHISVVVPTEQNIKQEMRREQREKQYKRAAAVAGVVYRKNGCRATYAELTGRIAVDYGISPRILAGLVFVESSCNPNAISGRKSVGLTQVNPLIWKASLDDLKNPEHNLRIGASILASYTHKFGLKEGLHHYNGLGDKSDFYSNKVLTAAGIQVS